MKLMFETVDIIGDRLVNAINKEYDVTNVLEMRVLAAKFTSDVIGNVAFGLECKCKKNCQLLWLLSSLNEILFILQASRIQTLCS